MKERIRLKASELGFDDCRFTTADPPDGSLHFQQWLAEKRQGTMGYLERKAAKRVNPSTVLSGAKSIICLAASYEHVRFTQTQPPGTGDLARHGSGIVAKYARFRDYHHVL